MEENKHITYQSIDQEKITPMMRQYLEQKNKWPDAILMFRLGDFYEMFFDDAVLAARELELALTGRDCGLEKRAPMCGVPHHASATYMQKLVSRGYKVAVCEQLEDPSEAKGIVRRAVTRVLTPGTLTDENGIDEKSNNFLVCLYRLGFQYGLAACDITTGTFEATQIISGNTAGKLMAQIARFGPSEIICNDALSRDTVFPSIKNQFTALISVRPDRDFDLDKASEYAPHLFVPTAGDWSSEQIANVLCKKAINALILYLEETQQRPISHLRALHLYRVEDTMELDMASRNNLELIRTLRSQTRKGSLLWAIDRTVTSMGARRLRLWLEQPLIDIQDIQMRLDAVAQAKEAYILRQSWIESLSGLHDLERLTSKISLGHANARDLLALRDILERLPELCQLAMSFEQGLFSQLVPMLNPLEDLFDMLDGSICPDPPVGLKEGGIIKDGFHDEVDKLRHTSKNSKTLLADIEANERETTGIKNLKISYNRVFGYYIEISKGNVSKAPDHYVRRQTLANSERYITDELKKLEDTILGAQQKLMVLEYNLFCDVRDATAKHADRLLRIAYALSCMDVITALAELADRERYVCPSLDTSDKLKIRGGRHPVVEKMLPRGSFVPNDAILDDDKRRIMLLTGPNMAGKSTYMRQIALIVLLAQMGSFVPADYAHIGVVDRIFTRIGASDDLSGGASTFMVEMNEVATILRNATRRSLLLLDEIGRGTSTYDGLSIAWAVLEYISGQGGIFARTFFATHYHELNQLQDKLSGLFNCHVCVDEKDGDIVFLHRVEEGGTDDSYGIEVARLAGVPETVVNRAKEILQTLEKHKKISAGPIKDTAMATDTKPMDGQIGILPSLSRPRGVDPIRHELQMLDIMTMTPLEAMNSLYALIDKAREDEAKDGTD